MPWSAESRPQALSAPRSPPREPFLSSSPKRPAAAMELDGGAAISLYTVARKQAVSADIDTAEIGGAPSRHVDDPRRRAMTDGPLSVFIASASEGKILDT